jgi:exodeoxyribonuclease V beta subunit
VDLALLVQRWIDGKERPAVEEGETQRLERDGGAVQVLTMHKAKGLQAPVVILFGGLSQGHPKANLHLYHLAGERRAWMGPVAAAPATVQALIKAEEGEEGERLAYVALTRAEAQLILPCYVPGEDLPSKQGSFEEDGNPKKGLYKGVNGRLRALLDPQPREDFERLPEAEPGVAPRNSNPGPWVLDLPAPLPTLAFPNLRKVGRPLWMFSYTSLQKGLKPGWGETIPQEEVKEFTPTVGPRGGKKLGTQVHAALERVDLASFRGLDQEAWLALPSTVALAAAWLPEEGRLEALRWIHHAMTLPYPLPDGSTAILHQSEELLRELDFLTPYAERQDFLHGSMDVLFQAGGKGYVLDWKTNRLPGFDPASLDQAVKEHYWLQVQIYASTACRFLGIRDEDHYDRAFGGVVYVFLRGLPEGGLWTCRPSWTELQAWEAELRALPVDQMIPPHAGGEPRDR